MALSARELEVEAEALRTATPQEVLAWAVETFGAKMSIACSFGVEDVVLVDMVAKLGVEPRLFFLDTGRLPQATYHVVDAVRERYKVPVDTYFPEREAVEQMVRLHGPNLFYDSVEQRKKCCGVRKVEPLRRALAELDAWVTGLRREQSVTRTDVPKLEIDTIHGGITKVNPLVEWSEDQVWEYVRAHRVPYNNLHDAGYPSIGCEPCTRAVKAGEDRRAGRWWWEQPTGRECGLHVK